MHSLNVQTIRTGLGTYSVEGVSGRLCVHSRCVCAECVHAKSCEALKDGRQKHRGKLDVMRVRICSSDAQTFFSIISQHFLLCAPIVCVVFTMFQYLLIACSKSAVVLV